MPLPSTDSCLLPILRISEDGAEHKRREYVALLSEHFALTNEDRSKRVESGFHQPVIYIRVNYAVKCLQEARLLVRTKKSTFVVTDRGKELLNENPARLSQGFLKRYPEFQRWLTMKGGFGAPPPDDDPEAWEHFARKVRRGQPKFRKALLEVYGGKCCISGSGVPEVLEAVHIMGHSETGNNDLNNGLLLRSDLHCLFDAGLIEIEPDSLQVRVSRKLSNTPYWNEFNGRSLRSRVVGPQFDSKYLRQRMQARRRKDERLDPS